MSVFLFFFWGIWSFWCKIVTEDRSFNCVTNGPAYRLAVRSTWKLRWFHGGMIFYNRMKFRSNPFSPSNVIESLSWFSHIHSKVKSHYKKRRLATGLRGPRLIHDNAPAHKCVLVQDFLKEEKVVQLSRPPHLTDFTPCNLFPFPLLKKAFSSRRYESQSALRSAIYQCLQGIPKKGLLLCLYRMDFET